MQCCSPNKKEKIFRLIFFSRYPVLFLFFFFLSSLFCFLCAVHCRSLQTFCVCMSGLFILWNKFCLQRTLGNPLSQKGPMLMTNVEGSMCMHTYTPRSLEIYICVIWLTNSKPFGFGSASLKLVPPTLKITQTIRAVYMEKFFVFFKTCAFWSCSLGQCH